MFVKSSEGLKSKFTLVALVASGKEIAYGMPLLVTSDEVHPLAGLLQRLGKLLALPVNFTLITIGLVLLPNVEEHLHGDLVAVKHLHAGHHQSCHGNLVLLLVHARNVPEQVHKHLGLFFISLLLLFQG